MKKLITRPKSHFVSSIIVYVVVGALVATNYQVNATNFCDLCKCFERETAFVIECNGSRRNSNSTSTTAHEMQYFEWPNTKRDTIVANFNFLNLTVLPR